MVLIAVADNPNMVTNTFDAGQYHVALQFQLSAQTAESEEPETRPLL
jgi:hypothetical protein